MSEKLLQAFMNVFELGFEPKLLMKNLSIFRKVSNVICFLCSKLTDAVLVANRSLQWP